MKHIRRGPYKRPRPFVRKEPKNRINEFVRHPEVRVLDENGAQIGVMSSYDALQIARERTLDLVEIAPMAKPPVCKIMDYGKFQYQQAKQDRVQKAKQKKFEIKGIRIGVRTDDHDLNFKKDQADKFLKKGNKLKVEIMLRGREKAHQDLARQTLLEFVKEISAPHKIEQEIKRYPGGFNIIISPI